MSQIKQGHETRTQLLRGALKLAETVAVTYGPYGRTCLLSRMAGLLATKDGVTVAQEISLAKGIENQGAALLKAACIKVNEKVGDGTTTTAILAAELLRGGHRLITAGFNSRKICEGVLAAAEEAEKNILQLSIPVESQKHLAQIATLASNNDTEVAEILAEAAMAVGKYGTTVIEDDVTTDVKLDFIEGLEIARGPIRSVFLRGQKERFMDGPLVAVIHSDLSTFEDVQELLETSAQWSPRELVIFSLSVSGDALKTIILNDGPKGQAHNVAISCPGYGHLRQEHLKDIAALTGATLVSRALGMSPRKWNPEWFGALRKVTLREKATTLIAYEDKVEGLQNYLVALQKESECCKSDFDRDQIQSRMAMLSGGLARVKVGGVTEAARKERRARIEDALAAVKMALQGGVVPGGGSAYLWAASFLLAPPGKDPEISLGWELLRQALSKPLHKLVQNAGGCGEIAVEQATKKWDTNDNPWLGWDVCTGCIRNLAEDPPIVDPTKVELMALQTAVSIATMLLSIDVSITKGQK